ncbi:MAG: aminotransferase class IV [Fibrobacterota bacterium]
MYPLIESIRVEAGRAHLIELHQERMDRSMAQQNAAAPNLQKILQKTTLPATGLHKLRILYDETLHDITCTPYRQKPIRSLRAVQDNHISYTLKYADRSELNRLFAQRGPCDDILIIRNGYCTDSSYCTVCVWDGKHWFTPNTPLLPGVMRCSLIEQGIVTPVKITPADLKHFSHLRCINAMRPLERAEDIPLRAVVRM